MVVGSIEGLVIWDILIFSGFTDDKNPYWTD